METIATQDAGFRDFNGRWNCVHLGIVFRASMAVLVRNCGTVPGCTLGC